MPLTYYKCAYLWFASLTAILCRIRVLSKPPFSWFSVSDILAFFKFLQDTILFWILRFMFIFLSMPSGSFLIGPYLSFKAKPKCYFVTESFLDQLHCVQYNILFVFFMELNILSISINELS